VCRQVAIHFQNRLLPWNWLDFELRCATWQWETGRTNRNLMNPIDSGDLEGPKDDGLGKGTKSCVRRS
jgi:hypothetical protein